MFQRTCLTVLFLFVLLTAASTAQEKVETVSVAELSKNAGKYKNKLVVVTGTVKAFKPIKRNNRDDRVNMKVAEGDDSFPVFYFVDDKPPLKDGDRVRITGLVEEYDNMLQLNASNSRRGKIEKLK